MTPGPPAAPTLSLVIPARDEAESLALLHAEVAAALDAIEGGYEVVFVDDGSVDESPAILAGLAAADHRVRVVRLETGRGQSAALDAGFRAASGSPPSMPTCRTIRPIFRGCSPIAPTVTSTS